MDQILYQLEQRNIGLVDSVKEISISKMMIAQEGRSHMMHEKNHFGPYSLLNQNEISRAIGDWRWEMDRIRELQPKKIVVEARWAGQKHRQAGIDGQKGFAVCLVGLEITHQTKRPSPAQASTKISHW